MTVTAPTTDLRGWRARFPALTYPNYRRWFVAQVFAAFGMWMQWTAQGYLVFELTKSPAFLGYVSFAGGLPTWLFMLHGGVIADRVPRRSLLRVTQVCMMCLGLALAVLTLSGLVHPWHILLLAFLLGVVNAFDAPARQAFTLEVVSRQDLANAIALNSTMFNMATAIGPAVAGLVYALVGPGACFLINGLSYIPVVLALTVMKLAPQPERLGRASMFSDLREGLSYTVREPVVRTLILLAGALSLFGVSFSTILPAWAVRILGGDATTNGLLMSARGVGSLLGALWIASLGRFTYKGKLLNISTFAVPLTLLVFAQIRWLPLSLVSLAATGLAMLPAINLANILVQTQVPDALRGRVMGVYTLIFMGMWPLGGLWVGQAAQHLGEPAAVIIGAMAMLVAAVTVYIRFPRLRSLE